MPRSPCLLPGSRPPQVATRRPAGCLHSLSTALGGGGGYMWGALQGLRDAIGRPASASTQGKGAARQQRMWTEHVWLRFAAVGPLLPLLLKRWTDICKLSPTTNSLLYQGCLEGFTRLRRGERLPVNLPEYFQSGVQARMGKQEAGLHRLQEKVLSSSWWPLLVARADVGGLHWSRMSRCLSARLDGVRVGFSTSLRYVRYQVGLTTGRTTNPGQAPPRTLFF